MPFGVSLAGMGCGLSARHRQGWLIEAGDGQSAREATVIGIETYQIYGGQLAVLAATRKSMERCAREVMEGLSPGISPAYVARLARATMARWLFFRQFKSAR